MDALEALHKGVLGSIVEEALSAHYSRKAEKEAREKEAALWQVIHRGISDITARYRPQIEALHAMNEELRDLEVPNLEQYEPDRAAPMADDVAYSWLLDSERTYLEQIDVYKEYGDGHTGR